MKKDFFNGRRTFLKKAGKAALAMSLTDMAMHAVAQKSDHVGVGSPVTGWEQTPLPYAYNALEPVIDTKTMEIHYTKHASAYAKNMAEAEDVANAVVFLASDKSRFITSSQLVLDAGLLTK